MASARTWVLGDWRSGGGECRTRNPVCGVAWRAVARLADGWSGPIPGIMTKKRLDPRVTAAMRRMQQTTVLMRDISAVERRWSSGSGNGIAK
eukprot:6802197-Prorocentrum_lima.AAC.1